MKRFIAILLLTSFSLYAGECEDLMAKYNTPKPETKTMKQLKRWAKRKLKQVTEKEKILKCLIDRAADNPNKATVAGE